MDAFLTIVVLLLALWCVRLEQRFAILEASYYRLRDALYEITDKKGRDDGQA